MSLWIRVSRRLTAALPDQGKRRERMQQGTVGLVVFVSLYLLGHFLPIGFDWRHFFSKGVFPSFWMPWTKPLVGWLNLPAIFALTILGVGLRAYQYKASPLTLALALISLPTLWVLFLGNFDGLVLIGLLILPWGVPLVLIKPQVASFALLASRRWFLAAAIWGLLSLVIWGPWPLNFNVILQPGWREEWPQDISLFPWGLLIALPLLWLSRGDEDMLMAAGSLGTPHLFPYHFIVLMPALARMSWPWRVVTWLSSWAPLLSNWLGPWAWHLGNLTGVLFWAGLYLDKRSKTAWPAR